MDKIDGVALSRIIIRLFAVLIFAWTVSTTPWLFTYLITGAGKPFSYFLGTVVFPLAMPMVMTLLLWFYAERLARGIVPEAIRDVTFPFSEQSLYLLSFLLLGLFVTTYAVVDLVAHCTSIFMQISSGDRHVEKITTYPDLVATIVELMLGLFIAFRRNELLKIVDWSRGRK